MDKCSGISEHKNSLCLALIGTAIFSNFLDNILCKLDVHVKSSLIWYFLCKACKWSKIKLCLWKLSNLVNYVFLTYPGMHFSQWTSLPSLQDCTKWATADYNTILLTLYNKPEKASTHKNAKTHAGTVFVLYDLDLLTPKQMGFQDSWLNISVPRLQWFLKYRADKQTDKCC